MERAKARRTGREAGTLERRFLVGVACFVAMVAAAGAVYGVHRVASLASDAVLPALFAGGAILVAAALRSLGE